MASSPETVALELSVQVGKAMADLQSVNAELKKLGQAGAGGLAPANEAMQGLERSSRSLYERMREGKMEAVQHQRVLGFYGRQLSSVAGEATGLATSLLGVGVALGSGMFVMAGIEAAKFGMELFTEHTKEAKIEAEKLAKVHLGVAKAIGDARDKMNEIAGVHDIGGQKEYKDVMRAASPGLSDTTEAIVAATPTKWQLIKAFIWDGAVGMERVREESEKLNHLLDTTIARTKEMAELAKVSSGDGITDEQDRATWKERAEKEIHSREAILGLRGREAAMMEPMAALQRKHAVEVEKIKADLMLTEEVRRRLLALAEREYKVAVEKRRLDETQTRTLLELQKAEKEGAFEIPHGADWGSKTPTQVAQEAQGNADKSWKDEMLAGPGNKEGESVFHAQVAALKNSAGQIKEAWASVGDAIGTVFSSIGSSIGGASGAFVSEMGRMLASALALVVALATTDTLSTGPQGIFAAIPVAAGILAGVIGMIASIGQRAMGGPVGPGTWLVGERGPEILQLGPGQAGSVVPNHQLGGGGAVTVHINAPIDAAWWRANERHIVRTLQEATRNGRA